MRFPEGNEWTRIPACLKELKEFFWTMVEKGYAIDIVNVCILIAMLLYLPRDFKKNNNFQE